MYTFKKAGFKVDWCGTCNFTFADIESELRIEQEGFAEWHANHSGNAEKILANMPVFSRENGDYLSLCFRVEPTGDSRFSAAYLASAILKHLSDEGFSPESMQDGNGTIFWICSREDIRCPSRFLQALGHRLECSIIAQQRDENIDAAISVEQDREALKKQQFDDHYSEDYWTND